ncbi:MAG: polysaccharide biosynthesis C-terminal domain-containing protein [Clostridia bacterium]|nr:polysaccharide biosynthesis C-terminal domain-containing protein [Clostridia bacterium]
MKVKSLTEGNIYKNYILYALPLIVSAILARLYGTVDSVIAGKCIGDLALGAVSAMGSIDAIFFALFNGFSVGFSIHLANLFGQRNYARIRRDTYATVIFIAAVSLLLGVLAVLFRNPLMDFLKVDEVLRRDAEIYFVIVILGSVFNYVNRIFAQVLPAMGITSFSLYLSVGSAVLNIVGNLICVVALRMGVAGLAIATVFSTAAITLIYFLILRNALRKLDLEKTPFRFRFSYVSESFRYTLPAAAQQLAFHWVGVLIAPPINGMGAAATTANNVNGQLYSICSITIWNMTSSISCYTAQSIGEGSVHKIPRGLRVGFLLNSVMLLPVLLSFYFFADPIVSIFFPEGFEGLALDYALRYVRVFLPFLLVQMADHVLHSYLRSLGAVNAVFYISLFGSTVRAVLTYALVPVLGMDGVYLSQIVSWAADLLVTVVLYLQKYRTVPQIQRIAQRINNR